MEAAIFRVCARHKLHIPNAQEECQQDFQRTVLPSPADFVPGIAGQIHAACELARLFKPALSFQGFGKYADNFANTAANTRRCIDGMTEVRKASL